MKRKKQIVYAVLGLILVSIGSMAWQLHRKVKVRTDARANSLQLPDFQFKTLDGEIFHRSDLKNGRKTVVMYFDPDCHLCEHQLEAMIGRRAEWADLNLLLVTAADRTAATRFARRFKLSDLKNVEVLLDEEYKFYAYFGLDSVPTTFIYNEEGELQKGFAGEVSYEILASYW